MKTIFERKPDFQFRDFTIKKSIRLPAEQFEQMLRKPLAEQLFLSDNVDLMWVDDKGVYHCLLVTGEGHSDGLLVESEGYSYARYASYVSEATALQYPSLSKMNQKLAAAVDFIIADGTSQTSSGNWILSFEELQEHTGIDVLGEPFVQEVLGDMLCDRPEVADLTIENDQFDVVYHLDFCPNCEQEEPHTLSPEMKL